MSDFHTIRSQIQESRSRLQQLDEEGRQLQGQRILLERRIADELRRQSKSELPAQHPLRAEHSELIPRIEEQEQEQKTLRETLTELESAFHELGSPQQQTENLNDQFPVLLLPLRLQTRFVNVKRVARGLTKEQVLDVSDFAGTELIEGINAPQKDPSAPFRLLTLETLSKGNREERQLHKEILTRIRRGQLDLTAQSWLSRTDDSRELWIRIYPDDIFIHTHEKELAEDEITAGKNYWREIWSFERSFQPAATQEGSAEIRQQGYLGPWRALQRAYGAARAGWIYRRTRPENLPAPDADWSEEPVFPDLIPKEDFWTRPPQSFTLPDRFVVRLYRDGASREVEGKPIIYPLILGLDPQDEGDETDEIPNSIRWLTDFSEAEKIGMAIRVPLSAAEAEGGIDQLIVLGLRTSADETASQELLGELLQNHTYKPEGMSFLPQGTPTNNYRHHKSGYQSRDDDAIPSMEAFTGPPLYDIQNDAAEQSDAQMLAEALGLAPDFFAHTEKADGHDFRQSRLMNTVLWPATWGYFLQQFLTPTLTSSDVESARDFFLNHISGGGTLPSLRIHRQPYGFLATTAYTKWQPDGSNTGNFAGRLYQNILRHLFSHWQTLTSHVQHIGTISDPNRVSDEFVKILGLYGHSTTFRQRHLLGESVVGALLDLSAQNLSQLLAGSIDQSELITKLRAMGLNITGEQEISSCVFHKDARLLNGPVVNSLPLSATRTLPFISEENFNTLGWLQQASWSDIHEEILFEEKNIAKPKDLLYLLARHALLREYLQTGITMLHDDTVIQTLHLLDFDFEYLATGNKMIPAQEQLARKILNKVKGPELRKEAQRIARENGIRDRIRRNIFIEGFVNKQLLLELNQIRQSFVRLPSKWHHFQQKIRGQEVGDRIDQGLQQPQMTGPLAGLSAMKAALGELTHLSTAGLERLFGEHIDLCHYRLDAWMQGLVHQRLFTNRSTEDLQRGIYLGAYGYLEDLRKGPTPGEIIEEITAPLSERPNTGNRFNQSVIPVVAFDSFRKENRDLQAWLKHSYIDLADDQQATLEYDARADRLIPPLRSSSEGEGFLLTPSIDHAKTAAVLRAGYKAHQQSSATAEDEAAEAFAVNVSSNRVRTALHYLQGIENGQQLGALLGYRFERSLYESQSPLVLGQYVLDIRIKFPLVADQATEDPDQNSTLVKEASQVVDGLALLKAYQAGNWHQGINIPAAATQQIEQLLQQLEDSMDAVNDLQMAESVYQMVKGNPDRAAAALRVLNTGGTFHMPEIIQAPQRGHLITQRFGICFPATGEAGNWGQRPSPRSLLAPGLNRWIGRQLPPPEKLVIVVRDNEGETLVCPISELNIQPIDLLYQLKNSTNIAALSELEQRIRQWAGLQHNITDLPPVVLQIEEALPNDQFHLYEILPLIRTLWSMLEKSRPLGAEHLLPPTQQLNEDAQNSVLDTTRLHQGLESIVLQIEEPNFASVLAELKNKRSSFNAQPDQSTYSGLFDALLACAMYGVQKAVPNRSTTYTDDNGIALVAQADRIVPEMESIQLLLAQLLEQARETASETQKLVYLSEAAHHLFGPDFLVVSDFQIQNQTEFASSLAYEDMLQQGGPFAMQEWLQGIAQVRPAMGKYQMSRQLGAGIGLASEEPQVIQLPFHAGKENRWVGIPFPSGYELDSDILSLVLDLPADFQPETIHSGLLLDEWKEVIPQRQVDAGIALHHNQPNAEAPQAVLLAVSPQQTGKWQWDDLVDTVKDTMLMAKMRLVSPEIIQEHSVLSHILPAVITALIDTGKAPSLDLDRNMRRAAGRPPFGMDISLPTTGTVLINP